MRGTLRVTILGCGSSAGTPRANGDWGKADPANPRNRRTRCSLLLQKWNAEPGAAAEATTVLIDTAPELREQLARVRVHHLDAVVFSHDHADQTHGIDDVRVFALTGRRPIPTWMDAATRLTMDARFGYCFESKAVVYPPILRHAGELCVGETFAVDGPGGAIEMTPLDQDHGFSRSLGFRVGCFAYSNDVVAMPDRTLAALTGLELWIVDALREAPSPTHAHLALTLDWIGHLRPSRAVLTNLHSDFDYEALAERLPTHVAPAFDGWQAELALD